jgi:hypothetical protein
MVVEARGVFDFVRDDFPLLIDRCCTILLGVCLPIKFWLHKILIGETLVQDINLRNFYPIIQIMPSQDGECLEKQGMLDKVRNKLFGI